MAKDEEGRSTAVVKSLSVQDLALPASSSEQRKTNDDDGWLKRKKKKFDIHNTVTVVFSSIIKNINKIKENPRLRAWLLIPSSPCPPRREKKSNNTSEAMKTKEQRKAIGKRRHEGNETLNAVTFSKAW